jgi:RNA methyltransferase, TrmH family
MRGFSARRQPRHDAAVDDDLIRRFRTARRDPQLAVVEGFHALKHALRFGAEVVEAVAVDPAELERLAADLAPDLVGELAARTVRVPAETLAELVPLAPRTGVVALARRPQVDAAAVLADPRPAPLVLLEEPRNVGNLGACVRVAAAAGAAGLLATGFNDPWHPDALRAGAGLAFALPVALVEALPSSDRRLIAIDPAGDLLRPAELPPRAIFAFGSEREGIGAELLARADARLGIPMPAGVSSLNLATAVSAVLFAQRLCRPDSV